MNDLQKVIYNQIKEAICGSIAPYYVRYNAIKVETPFLDWVGEPVSVYITEQGNVTDGEETLNQIKAGRAFKEFSKWADRADYFEDYNINLVGNSLDAHYLESAEDILRYVQGISRLPILFEAKPMSDVDDRFLDTVRNEVLDALMSTYPNRPHEDTFTWARKLSFPYSFNTKKGIRIHSDMHPKNKNKNVQIVGMIASQDSEKRAHIASKLYNPLQWGRENLHVQTVIIIQDTSRYPKDSQDAMYEIGEVIEYRKGTSAIDDICKQVAEA